MIKYNQIMNGYKIIVDEPLVLNIPDVNGYKVYSDHNRAAGLHLHKKVYSNGNGTYIQLTPYLDGMMLIGNDNYLMYNSMDEVYAYDMGAILESFSSDAISFTVVSRDDGKDLKVSVVSRDSTVVPPKDMLVFKNCSRYLPVSITANELVSFIIHLRSMMKSISYALGVSIPVDPLQHSKFTHQLKNTVEYKDDSYPSKVDYLLNIINSHIVDTDYDIIIRKGKKPLIAKR